MWRQGDRWRSATRERVVQFPRHDEIDILGKPLVAAGIDRQSTGDEVAYLRIVQSVRDDLETGDFHGGRLPMRGAGLKSRGRDPGSTRMLRLVAITRLRIEYNVDPCKRFSPIWVMTNRMGGANVRAGEQGSNATAAAPKTTPTLKKGNPMNMRTGILAGAALLLLAASAQAALLGRAPLTPGGTDYQAYYDNVLNITWMTDANLAATNTFGVGGIGSTGLAKGQMNWYTANQWIEAMNTANHLGVNDWRLPIITDTGPPGCDFSFGGSDCGYKTAAISGATVDDVFDPDLYAMYNTLVMSGSTVLSEMAYLGQVYHIWSAGPGVFSHVKSGWYWSGATHIEDDNVAWYYLFNTDYQAHVEKSWSGLYAWPVRDGDIASASTVPVPAAGWLFASTLGLLGWRRRARSA